MALFGAPITLEDAPQRAIRSAYAIHREVFRFSEKMKEEGTIVTPIRMRIGIHTGPVVVGTLGNDLRVEFKAVGDTVNIAARMEGLAEPGATYVTEHTFKLTEGLFRFEALGKKKIKGKEEPVNVYRVIAPSTRKTRFDVSAERGLTIFVGREREFELLMDGFERAKSGKGQAFSIMAEAGVGKSRLLYEFRKAIAIEDVTFLEGRCLSYSRGEAYHPVIDIVKANFDIQEGDGDFDIKQKVAEGLKALRVDEASNLPYLLELLSAGKTIFEKTGMTPAIRKDRINEALKRICLGGSEIRPLIMAFEDLHWIDKSSEDALKNWLDNISGSRVLLIFTYRPDYVHTWGGKSYHSQINLNRLSNRESLKMAYHFFKTQDLEKNLEEFILEKTEGVPFFIEETIRSLKDLNMIERKGNKYFLSTNISDVTVPSTIHDVIMARVDTLPEGAKEILRTGSAIEREFSYKLISQLMDMSEQELLSHLSALKDSELLYERGIYPQSTFIFKHALTREVVYDSVMTNVKKKLHGKIGDAMEELYKNNIDEYYAILAEQYMRSENYVKCADYSIKAGDKAVAVFAWHEARNHYESALKNLDGENVGQKADILKKLALVNQSELDSDTSLKYAQSALSLYEKLNDKPNQLEVLMHIQSIYSGGYLDGSKEDKALEYLERAAKIVENDADTQEKGLIYQRTAHLYLHRGQPAKTLIWSQKAAELFSKLELPIGTSLGTALTYTGCIDDGLMYNEQNWDSVLMAGNPLIIAILGHELTLTRALLRDVPKGREWGEKILPEVTKAGDRFEGFIWRPLALIYAQSGEFSKAEKACKAEKKIENKTLMSCFFEDAACIGFHYLRQGKWNQAKEYLEWAILIHKERNNVAAIGACYFTLGTLKMEQKKYIEAEKHLLMSLDICRKGGNVIFELWVIPLLCELYLLAEQSEKASEYMQRGFELLTPDQNWYGLPAQVYLVNAMMATKQRNWEMATEFFNKAIQINRKYELLWDEAKTNYEWGKMYLTRNQKGDAKAASEKLSLSSDIFTRIGAKKDLDKALSKRIV
jgi:tetratricopeptide (TPR) repeat protein